MMSVPLDDAFEATRWPNLTFLLSFWCATMSSCTRCDAWWCMVVGLLLMIVSFFSFLFSLLPDKVYDCSLWFWFWFFDFSSYFFFTSYFILVLFIVFFFNLVLELQFLIYFFFISVLILLIFIFFLALLLKLFLLSISSFNQSFYCFIFFSI